MILGSEYKCCKEMMPTERARGDFWKELLNIFPIRTTQLATVSHIARQVDKSEANQIMYNINKSLKQRL